MGPVLLGLAVGWVTAHGTKSQVVRALDVLVVGPLLIFGTMRPATRRFLGGATVGYNLRNYLLTRAQESPGLTAPGAPV